MDLIDLTKLEGIKDMCLVAQGAEATLKKGIYLGKNVLIKQRLIKKYRHIELDNRLTKDRIKAEARAIVRAKAAGVATPALYLVDYNRRSIFMEFIENSITLKQLIEKYISKKNEAENLTHNITSALGKAIAKMHSKRIIHGDLTTSNVLVKNPTDLLNLSRGHDISDKLVVIDFGLSRTESTSEDAAVDLYVLERSLSSAHAELPQLFELIFRYYQNHFKNKSLMQEIIVKYDDVKARGRKRTMVG